MIYSFVCNRIGERCHKITSDSGVETVVFADKTSPKGDGVVQSILKQRCLSAKDWDSEYIRQMACYDISTKQYEYAQLGADIPSIAQFAWGLFQIMRDVEKTSPQIINNTMAFGRSGELIDDPFLFVNVIYQDDSFIIGESLNFFGRDYNYKKMHSVNEECEAMFGSPISVSEATERYNTQFGVIDSASRSSVRHIPKNELSKLVSRQQTVPMMDCIELMASLERDIRLKKVNDYLETRKKNQAAVKKGVM